MAKIFASCYFPVDATIIFLIKELEMLENIKIYFKNLIAKKKKNKYEGRLKIEMKTLILINRYDSFVTIHDDTNKAQNFPND